MEDPQRRSGHGFWSRSHRASGQEPGFEPPLAPVAQWCARMTVLSTICTESLPPPSARASSIRFHNPAVVQRRYCRCTEFQLPSPQEDRATALRCGQSRTPRSACGGGRQADDHARHDAPSRTARRKPIPHHSEGLGPPLISHMKISFESHHTASGESFSRAVSTRPRKP